MIQIGAVKSEADMPRTAAGSIALDLAFIVVLSLLLTACGGGDLPSEARDFAVEYLATRHDTADDWAISSVQPVPNDRVAGADEQWCLKVQEIDKEGDFVLGRLAGVSHYILSRSGHEYRIDPVISSDNWYLHDCVGW